MHYTKEDIAKLLQKMEMIKPLSQRERLLSVIIILTANSIDEKYELLADLLLARE